MKHNRLTEAMKGEINDLHDDEKLRVAFYALNTMRFGGIGDDGFEHITIARSHLTLAAKERED